MNQSARSYLRGQLRKVKFTLGIDPIVEHSDDNNHSYIPTYFKAVCLISVDFELAWGFRFSNATEDPLHRAISLGMQTRENVPIILNLCEIYEIPFTWATVGHLFLSSCERTGGLPHNNIKRIQYFRNQYWNFDQRDWFAHDPCTNYVTDPAWYCPDLIRQIYASAAGHEIGCHTFSHIDCSDSICPDEVFKSEMMECQKLADQFGVRLKSFVHPGHQIGNLDNLAQLGFTSYRTDQGDTLANPCRHRSGLWQFKNTAELCLRKGLSTNYQIKRYKTIIDRAIKYHKVCVFWFHPSLPVGFFHQVLPEVLAYLQLRRNEICSLTHAKYSDFLDRYN